jgi:MYXO-CTERM domain-containing protein
MMFLRILGVWLLLLAMVAAVMDATKSLAGGGAWVVTPLLQQWASLSPETLAAAKAAVETHMGSFFWNPVLTEMLNSPTWGVFGILGLVLYWLGRRRAPKEVFIN